MGRRRKEAHQFLVGTPEQAVELLEELVNLPDREMVESLLNLSDKELEKLRERFGAALSGSKVHHIRTIRFKDLFDFGHAEPSEVSDRRLIEVLKQLRFYLRQFWGTTDAVARDWYLHRAREYYQRFRIQRSTAKARESEMAAAHGEEKAAVLSRWNTVMEDELDSPPAPNLLEDALFYLQSIANKALQCPNPSCRRYFLARIKGQKFCVPNGKCGRPTELASKRKSWQEHKHEWGKQ